MGRKKKEIMELRYYDIPQKEAVLALLGEEWIREYGTEITLLHFHNMMEIGYCRSGNGTLQLDEKVIPYKNGMLSIIPKNYPHTTNSVIGKKCYWEYLFFDPESLLRTIYPENELYQRKILQLMNRKANFVCEQNSPQITSIVLNIMEEMRNKNEFYIDTVRALTTALMLEIARVNSVENKEMPLIEKTRIVQIKEALNYISAEYQNHIRIEVIAKQCNMSETHFRRIFEENMNMTPVEYINMVRIQMACEVIKKSNHSMDEIAMKVGFTTISTFNRNFKKIVGMTPCEWKKNSENYERKLLQFNISAAKGW